MQFNAKLVNILGMKVLMEIDLLLNFLSKNRPQIREISCGVLLPLEFDQSWSIVFDTEYVTNRWYRSMLVDSALICNISQHSK